MTREELKISLFLSQRKRCALSGEETDQLDMHEWLVPRNALPIKRKQQKIFHPINCILITRKEHDSTNRYRRDYNCLLYKLQQYSLQEINDWLISLELRTFGTLQQWIARHEHALEIGDDKKIKYD